MEKPVKKLIFASALVAVGVYAYSRYQKNKNMIAVSQIQHQDILEMLEDKGFDLAQESKDSISMIKDDHREGLRIVMDRDDMYVEYFNKDLSIDNLSDVSSPKAYSGFRNLLGSMGVTEARFKDFVKEILSQEV